MIKKRKKILIVATVGFFAITSLALTSIIILGQNSSNYLKLYNYEYKYNKNGDILASFNLDKNFASKIAKSKFINKNNDSEFVSFEVDKTGTLAINHPTNLDESFKLTSIEIQGKPIFKTDYENAPIFKPVMWNNTTEKLQFNKNLTANRNVFLILKNESGYSVKKNIAVDSLGQSTQLNSNSLDLEQKLAIREIYFFDEKTKSEQPINLNDLFVEFAGKKVVENLANQSNPENVSVPEKKFSIIKSVEQNDEAVDIYFNFIDPEITSSNLVLTINSEDGQTKLSSKYGYFDFEKKLYHFVFDKILPNNKYLLSNIYFIDSKNKLNEIKIQNNIESFTFVKHFEPIKIKEIKHLKSNFIDQICGVLELQDENSTLKQGDKIKLFASENQKEFESIGEVFEEKGKIFLKFHFNILPNKSVKIEKLEPYEIKKKLWLKNTEKPIFHEKLAKSNLFSLENKIKLDKIQQLNLDSFQMNLVSETIDLNGVQVKVDLNEKDNQNRKTVATNYKKFNNDLAFDNIHFENNKKYVINTVNFRQNDKIVPIDFSSNFVFDTSVLTLKELKFKDFSENKLIISGKILNNNSKNLTLILRDKNQTFKSSSVKTSGENVEFTFENIDSNRIFDFDSIETDEKWISTQNFKVSIEPKGIEIVKNGDNFTNLTINSANFSAELKSSDNVFSENQTVSAVLTTEKNDKSETFQGKITKKDQKWMLNFNFSGLKSETKYKIQRLSFNTKPEKAWKNYKLNGLEGVFYDSSIEKANQFEFSTIKNTVGLTVFDQTESPFTKERELKIELTDKNKFKENKAKLIFQEAESSTGKEIASEFFVENESVIKTKITLEKTNTFYELVAIQTSDNERIKVEKSQSIKIFANDIFEQGTPIFSSNNLNSVDGIIPFADKSQKIKENDKAKITYKTKDGESLEAEATVENSQQKSGKPEENLQYLRVKFQNLKVNQKYQIETIEFGTEKKINYFNKENTEKFSFENKIDLVDNLKIDEKTGVVSFDVSSNVDLSKNTQLFDLELQHQEKEDSLVKLFRAKIEKVNNSNLEANRIRSHFQFKLSFTFAKSEIEKIKTGNYKIKSFSWNQSRNKQILDTGMLKSVIKLTSFDDIRKEIAQKWTEFAKENRWKFVSEISETEIENVLKSNSSLFSNLKITKEKNFPNYLQPQYQLDYLGSQFSEFLEKQNFNFVDYNILKNPGQIWGFGDTKYSTYFSYKYRPENVFGQGNTYWYHDNYGNQSGTEFKMIPKNVSQYPHGFYVEGVRLRFFENSDYTPINRKDWWKDYISVSYEDVDGKIHELDKENIGDPSKIAEIDKQLSLTITVKKRLKKLIFRFNNKMGNKYIAIARIHFAGFANKNKDF